MDGGDEVLAHARVEALLRAHRGTLLRLARRWSASAEDAEDALQRALEIYVRRVHAVAPATELAWLKVVLRHEALALRQKHADGTPLEERELESRLPADTAGVEERLESDERTARSLEALGRLKPDERTALLLKAEGYSYAEIGRRQGWTYTKTNRAITEGRRRFLDVFRRIETGEECGRHAPALLRLAEGAGAAAEVVALRPHLRHCTACRATVRELHRSRLHRFVLHLPLVATIAPARWLADRFAAEPQAAPSPPPGAELAVADRLEGAAPPIDVGDLLERAAAPAHEARSVVHQLIARFHGPDLVTGAQLASSGGGRGAAAAAIAGLCLGAGGAGTYCLSNGDLPDPGRLLGAEAKPKRHAKAEPKPKRRAEPERRALAATPTVAATVPEPKRPLATATPAPVRRARAARRAASRPRAAPPSAEPQQREFSFETQAAAAPAADPPPVAQSASAGPSGGAAPSSGSAGTPARAASGGGEFLP